MDQKSRDKLAKPMDWKKAYPEKKPRKSLLVDGNEKPSASELEKESALKKARRELAELLPQSKGSRGRESAGKQRDRDARVLIRSGAVDNK